jgi:hypothetical protein
MRSKATIPQTPQAQLSKTSLSNIWKLAALLVAAAAAGLQSVGA